MTHSVQAAESRRDIGMAISEIRANRDDPGWSDRAYKAIFLYCFHFPKAPFLTEDVREWAEAHGHVSPPANGKSWGAIIRRCAKEGLIEQVGYLPAKSSNMSPKCAWISKV